VSILQGHQRLVDRQILTVPSPDPETRLLPVHVPRQSLHHLPRRSVADPDHPLIGYDNPLGVEVDERQTAALGRVVACFLPRFRIEDEEGRLACCRYPMDVT
jgi:hypothetical protein